MTPTLDLLDFARLFWAGYHASRKCNMSSSCLESDVALALILEPCGTSVVPLCLDPCSGASTKSLLKSVPLRFPWQRLVDTTWREFAPAESRNVVFAL